MLEDALIIGSHDHLIEPPCPASLFVYPLNNGFSTNFRQWLARKTGRSKTCGYDTYCFHIFVFNKLETL